MPAKWLFADIIDVSHVSIYQIRIVGPGGERVERLQKDDCVIGRSTQADLVVANVEVSRKHVSLKFDGTQLWITDEGSKNGTFLDGVKIQPNIARPWRVGQFIKMGLAPERLTLEMVSEVSLTSNFDAKTNADAPPPVESVVRSISKISAISEVRPDNSVEKSKTDVPVKERAAELMADFEKKMQQVLSRAEVSRGKDEAPPVVDKKEEPVVAVRENVRSESQIRDLSEEVRNRLSERKALARENAEIKLAIQTSRVELERLKVAQSQIAPALAQENKLVEEQIQKSKAEFETELAKFKAQAQREAKELIEKSKKQAEMISNEAEMKAKALRDKLQTQMADERKSSELELAEQKLKQVADLKQTQEKLEGVWQSRKEELAAAFLRDVRTRCENQIFATQMESGIKLRLLTSIEESLHQHFLGTSSTLDMEDEEVTADRQPLVVADETDEPEFTRAPMFKLTSRGLWSVMAAMIIGAMSILLFSKNSPGVKMATSVTSQVPTVSEVKSQASLLPPPASTASINTINRQAPVGDAWSQILRPNLLSQWQAQSSAYLQESLKLDRRKINRYQALEAQFATELAGIQSRLPASENESEQAKARFESNATALLGSAQWNKFMAYREYFRIRNP